MARSAKKDRAVSVAGQGRGRDQTGRHGRLEQLAVPVLVGRAYANGGIVSGNRGADRFPDELESLPVAVARGKRIPTAPVTVPVVGVPVTGADPLDQVCPRRHLPLPEVVERCTERKPYGVVGALRRVDDELTPRRGDP